MNMLLSIQPLMCESEGHYKCQPLLLVVQICPQCCCKEIALCHLHLPFAFFSLIYSPSVQVSLREAGERERDSEREREREGGGGRLERMVPCSNLSLLVVLQCGMHAACYI